MDVSALAAAAVAYLAPFLPYLLKAGEKAAEEGGKKLGAEAWEKAKAVWARLGSKVEAKPAAIEAARDLGENPDDEDARAALRLQLEKLLEDTSLAAELQKLVGDLRPGVVNVIASGERSVAINEARDVDITIGDTHTDKP